ncbi:hypothetical protein TIFTF001_021972 [Ficus carica]|uniref:Uncharacterized protein n=1 Tax=Ficus carica TaxID=3494 RepID=A0AA88DJW8_FICCA|nr:hypothetical protein TIFTF001_021972 [Ficus carica]
MDSFRRAEKRALEFGFAETRSEGLEDSPEDAEEEEEDKLKTTWLKLRELRLGFVYGQKIGPNFTEEDDDEHEGEDEEVALTAIF